jgi:hypothetical protein
VVVVETVEVVESMKSIEPSEAAVIETTKPIISIEISVAKALEARW